MDKDDKDKILAQASKARTEIMAITDHYMNIITEDIIGLLNIKSNYDNIFNFNIIPNDDNSERNILHAIIERMIENAMDNIKETITDEFYEVYSMVRSCKE